MKWHQTGLVVVMSAAMSESTIQWLGTKEAAERMGITPRTLYKLANEGKLPMYRMGRVFRLKQDDVDAFIETTRVEPGSLSHLYPDGGTSVAGRPEVNNTATNDSSLR